MKPRFQGEHEINVNHKLGDQVVLFDRKNARYRYKEGIIEEIHVNKHELIYYINCSNIYNNIFEGQEIYGIKQSKIISPENKVKYKVNFAVGDRANFYYRNTIVKGTVRLLQFCINHESSFSLISIGRGKSFACFDDRLKIASVE